MDIQLFSGAFKSKDALDLITQMIQVKIKYHENMIDNMTNEDDIKFRESKIKSLYNTLQDFKNNTALQKENIEIDSLIKIK